ncbi:MAG: hypothetical protein WC314_11530 [Vulcanimicrobiota bacterium]
MRWYRTKRRVLPWRETREPYAILVSEVMLQQTTVAAVVPRYQQWMRRFPTVEALARAEESEVLSQWSGLGYYQRARRLHQAAQEVTRRGEFPDSLEGLQALPGVGAYTAAAVSSICFERPELAIDTNLIRVLFRYYAIRKPAQNSAVHRTLREQFRPLLEFCSPGEANQALMELGATVCRPDPVCSECPLQKSCAGRQATGGATMFPQNVPKKRARLTPGRALVLQDSQERRTLMVKGTSLGLLAPLFQPPIMFSAEESCQQMQQAFEELYADLPASDRSWRISYSISGRKLDLDCRQWFLESEVFGRAERHLSSVLQVACYRFQEDNGPTPLSSLSRKILRRAMESP